MGLADTATNLEYKCWRIYFDRLSHRRRRRLQRVARRRDSHTPAVSWTSPSPEERERLVKSNGSWFTVTDSFSDEPKPRSLNNEWWIMGAESSFGMSCGGSYGGWAWIGFGTDVSRVVTITSGWNLPIWEEGIASHWASVHLRFALCLAQSMKWLVSSTYEWFYCCEAGETIRALSLYVWICVSSEIQIYKSFDHFQDQ